MRKRHSPQPDFNIIPIEKIQLPSAKTFVVLRKAHSAVESDIHSLEHHGLNRCLDVGLAGYLRYVGYGVMSYNLHVIGRQLLQQPCQRGQPQALAA